MASLNDHINNEVQTNDKVKKRVVKRDTKKRILSTKIKPDKDIRGKRNKSAFIRRKVGKANRLRTLITKKKKKNTGIKRNRDGLRARSKLRMHVITVGFIQCTTNTDKRGGRIMDRILSCIEYNL